MRCSWGTLCSWLCAFGDVPDKSPYVVPIQNLDVPDSCLTEMLDSDMEINPTGNKTTNTEKHIEILKHKSQVLIPMFCHRMPEYSFWLLLRILLNVSVPDGFWGRDPQFWAQNATINVWVTFLVNWIMERGKWTRTSSEWFKLDKKYKGHQTWHLEISRINAANAQEHSD